MVRNKLLLSRKCLTMENTWLAKSKKTSSANQRALLVMSFSKTLVTMAAIVMTSALLISLILDLRSNGGHLELKR